jgi:hypothetical protein
LDFIMDLLSEHRNVLEVAIAGTLPSHIDHNSDIPVGIFRELFEQGLVAGKDVSTLSAGPAYMNPEITLKGREYLNDLNQRREERSLKGRVKKLGWLILGWLGGVVSAVLAAWAGKLL